MNRLLEEHNQQEISNEDEAAYERNYSEIPVRDLQLGEERDNWRNDDNHYDEVRQSAQFTNEGQ